jgi:hypothetical protein
MISTTRLPAILYTVKFTCAGTVHTSAQYVSALCTRTSLVGTVHYVQAHLEYCAECVGSAMHDAAPFSTVNSLQFQA